MKRSGDIWVDWLDSAIRVLIRDLPELLNGFPYKLITCVDSIRDLDKVSSVSQIVRNFSKCRLKDGGLLIVGPGLDRIAKSYNLFNGFDEVWFFLSEPVESVPAGIWLTGPLEIDKDVPDKLSEWMTSSGCVLGLGDGNGLNYATTNRSVAESLAAFEHRSRV
jgi:hypothetical protein